jgi:O-antigen/teichoic acid export membrane protein
VIDDPSTPDNSVGNREVQRVAGGALIALAGGGVSFVLSFAYQVVLGRSMGPVGVGLLFLGLAIANLLAEGSDLGLDYGLLRLGSISYRSGETGRYRAVVRQGLLGSLIAGAVAGAVLAACSTFVAHLFDKDDLAPVLVPLAFAVPFIASSEIVRAALRAMGDARRPVASKSLIAPTLRLVTAVLAITVSPSAEAAAWAYLITECLVFFITAWMLRRQLPPADEHVAHASGLFRFSLPMSFNRILLYGNNQTEVVILGLFASASAVGIFGIARRLSVLVGALLASISILFNPMVADLHHSQRLEELDRVFKTSTRWVFTIALPVCLVEVLFAQDILEFVGKEFANGTTALMVLALGQLINVGTGTISNLQAMAGYAKVTLLNSLFLISMSIVLDLLLIPPFGVLGAAIAAMTSLVTVNLLRLWQIRKNIGLVPYDRSFLRPIVAAVPAAVVSMLVPIPHVAHVVEVIVRALILGGVYVGMLFALGFEPVDREIGRAAIARARGWLRYSRSA